MYLKHWALRDQPFHHPRLGEGFFEGPTQEEALARLEFLINHQHRLGILSGEAGSGKSALLAVLAERLRAQARQVIHVNLQGMDARELWWKLADGFALNLPREPSSFELWRRINDRLRLSRYTATRTVLVLDDADEAQSDALAGLARLLAVDSHDPVLLNLVLSCRNGGHSRLGERIVEEAELLVQLEPLSVEETHDYLHQSIARAGQPEPIFTRAAIDHLHDLSDGLFRRLNHLADLALVAAAAQQLPHVDAEIVDAVYDELDASQPRRLIA